jgi:hypothetical protein
VFSNSTQSGSNFGGANADANQSDRTARIVHELMRNFVVRSALDPRDKSEKVLKVWREAALIGR